MRIKQQSTRKGKSVVNAKSAKSMTSDMAKQMIREKIVLIAKTAQRRLSRFSTHATSQAILNLLMPSDVSIER